MSLMIVLNILFRWMHVVAACLAVGGAFFIRVVLPAATRPLGEEHAQAVFLRARRGFKMVIHSAILALLVSGAYNAYQNWHWYAQNPPLLHSLFGMHMLLGLGVMTLSLVVLAGGEPIRSHRSLMKLNLFLMALAILAASALKWGRDNTQPPQVPYKFPAKHVDAAHSMREVHDG